MIYEPIMKPLCLFILALSCNSVFSQEPLITLKAGEDISALYKYVYRYPQFIPGKVYFQDGDSAGASMNYNLFDGEIHFISKADTMLIDDKSKIRSVVIDADSFVFADGQFLRILTDYGYAKLAVADKLRLHDEQRIGAMGMARPTHNIDSKSSFNSWQTLKLQLSRDLIFSKEKHFYFTSGSAYLPANRKNLPGLFAFAGKKAFEEYEKTCHPNLKNETDIESLFSCMARQYKSMNR